MTRAAPTRLSGPLLKLLAPSVFAGIEPLEPRIAPAFASVLQLSSIDGVKGFQINGANGDRAGYSVSDAGDVNGDGFDDVIIGAHGGDPNGNYSGTSYVVFGKAAGFSAELELSTLDGANGFKMNVEATRDYSGMSVSGAGDVVERHRSGHKRPSRCRHD